jgi:hypothetical protein
MKKVIFHLPENTKFVDGQPIIGSWLLPDDRLIKAPCTLPYEIIDIEKLVVPSGVEPES